MDIDNKKNNDKKNSKNDFAFMVFFFVLVVIVVFSVYSLLKGKATRYTQPLGGINVSIDYSAASSIMPPVSNADYAKNAADDAITESSIISGNDGVFDPASEASGIDYDSLPFYQKAKEYQEATEGVSEIDPSTLSSELNNYTADMNAAAYTADGGREELVEDPTGTYPAAAYTVLYKILDNYGWTHYQLLDTGYENGEYYLMYVFAVGYSNGMKAEYSIYYAPTDNIAWGIRVEEGYYDYYPSPSDDGWISLK